MGWGWGGVGHVSIHVKLHTVDVTLQVWGGVGHVSIHVKLHTLWMLSCRFGVGHVNIHVKPLQFAFKLSSLF